jgi:hypothetical protein
MDSGNEAPDHELTTSPPARGKPARPPFIGLVYYTVGGTLPTSHLAWVSNDLVGPRWRVRQAVRPLIIMLPFAIVFALLPGQLGIRLMLSSFLLVAALGVGFASSSHFRDRRLDQHGLPPVRRREEDEDDAEEDARLPQHSTAAAAGGAATAATAATAAEAAEAAEDVAKDF